jgi:hypothetical protein
VRQFPFNAQDALNLINPHSTATKKAPARKKTTSKTPAKKAAPKKQ